MSIVKGLNIVQNNSYTLPAAAKVSADVRDSSGKLIRTLFSGKDQQAGNYTRPFWDGKDNTGNLVADGSYQLKITRNNIAYTWYPIGNTSVPNIGPTVHHAQDVITSMCFVGNFCYYSVGYSEGGQGIEKFDINTPQQKINYLPEYGGSPLYEATDGVYVYHAGSGFQFDSSTPSGVDGTQFVYATRVSDDVPVTFANGVDTTAAFARHTFSAIDITKSTIFSGNPANVNIPECSMGGMAVQQSGNYLFVSYYDRNEIHVTNKTTGALVQTITGLTNPKALCIDKNNDNALWIASGSNTLAKYTINSNGTLTAATLTLSGLVSPLSVTCKAGILAVMDGSTRQQVRFFNNSTGVEGTPLGQLGGYTISSAVANDKFMFKNTKEFFRGERNNFIAYGLDGSLWVGDRGNYRVQHFSASNVFIETIMNIGYFYDSKVLKADPSQMFANYLQFNVNLTDFAWSLTHNWAYNITSDSDIQGGRLTGLYKASNNRVYALSPHNHIENGQTFYRYQFIELVEGGNIRFIPGDIEFTGQQFDVFYALNSDDSILRISSRTIGQPAQWIRTPLTYNSSNNPVLGTDVVLASIPTVLETDPITSIGSDQITTSGKIISFDAERGVGNHLGGVLPAGTDWLWQSARSTVLTYNGPFPTDFDIGNSVQYPGATMNVADNIICYSYEGGFWKSSLVDKVILYSEDGTYLFQAGLTGPESLTLGEAPAGFSANTIAGTFRKLPDGRYLHATCDEGVHGAIRLFVFAGMDTIQQQIFLVVKNGTPVAPAVSYIDLMADVPYSQNPFTSTATWTRSPAGDINYVDGRFLFMKTSDQTYKTTERDINVFSIPTTGQTALVTLQRTLYPVNPLGWKITGQFSFTGIIDEASNASRGYLEILDGTGKIIFQLSAVAYANLTDYRLILNNTTAYQAAAFDFFAKITYLENIEIAVTSAGVALKYKDITATAPLLDNSAAWQTPALIRIRMTGSAGHTMDVANLKLYPNG